MQGASPLASPGWAGRGTGLTSVSDTRRGACPLGRRFAHAATVPCGEAYFLCRLPTLPLAYLSAPIPPPPFPAGRGRFLVFLCKGLRPLHPRGWTGRGTGSVSVGGAPWGGLALLVAGSPLPLWFPVGGLPALSPAYPVFSLFVCPHPPNPLPSGKGETISLFCRGLRPRHPGIRPFTALTTTATAVPGGVLAFFVACLSCL